MVVAKILASGDIISSTAEKVVSAWNKEHYRRLRLGEAGLGGALPIESARLRVANMSNMAMRRMTTAPTEYAPLFVAQTLRGQPKPIAGAMLQQEPQPVSRPLIPEIRRKAGRPKGQPRELPPLNQLTRATALTLTVRELRLYTQEIAHRSPATKQEALTIVLDYWMDYVDDIPYIRL